MLRSYQGRFPIVPATAYVDPSAQVLGDVTLGEHSSVWMNAVLRGDVNSITIGVGSNVQDCAVVHGQRNVYPVVVGNGVTIGHNATVHGCTLEADVLIGIGAGSIIAAGALVPERTVIPPASLVTGVPGKIRRVLGETDLALIRQYARNYLDYTKIYLGEAGAMGVRDVDRA